MSEYRVHVTTRWIEKYYGNQMAWNREIVNPWGRDSAIGGIVTGAMPLRSIW